jgi:exopolysaccharide biosynthesis polyprenyl glycosylphosphotransferase
MTSSRRLPYLFLGIDLVSTLVVFVVLGSLRGIDVGLEYVGGVLGAPFLFIVLSLSLIDGYKARANMLSVDYASQHTIAMFMAMLGTFLTTYVAITSSFALHGSRLVIVGSFLALMPLTLGFRRLVQYRRSLKHWNRSILYLGDREGWELFKADYQLHRTTNPLLFCDIDPLSSSLYEASDSLPLEIVLEDVTNGSLEVEAIVLQEDRSYLNPETEKRLVQLYFSGISTYTLELFHQTYWRKFPLNRLNKSWLFREGFHIAREPVVRQVKRLTDILAALVGLLLISPLLLLAALAIWLEDRGPVFFSQNRIGKDDKAFPILKLRTMHTQGRTDGADGRYTQKNDPRITRVGRLLRSSRLDEFPQLWNVLRGEMSLIGPRAEWDLLVSGYELEIPHYRFRHLVKPGITGWAQVNHPYGTGLDDTRRKLEYDLYYIRHYSLKLDATIVLKTLHVILFGKGQ